MLVREIQVGLIFCIVKTKYWPESQRHSWCSLKTFSKEVGGVSIHRVRPKNWMVFMLRMQKAFHVLVVFNASTASTSSTDCAAAARGSMVEIPQIDLLYDQGLLFQYDLWHKDLLNLRLAMHTGLVWIYPCRTVLTLISWQNLFRLMIGLLNEIFRTHSKLNFIILQEHFPLYVQNIHIKHKINNMLNTRMRLLQKQTQFVSHSQSGSASAN